LGCVDSARIRRGFEQACRTGDQSQAGAIAYTLAVETWLQVRSGRRVAARSNCTSRETTYDRSLTAASSNRRLDAAAI
jgi:hypothetical protein